MPSPMIRASLLAVLLGAGTAVAQTAPDAKPAAAQPGDRLLAEMPAGGLRASKLVGVEVVGMDHVRIGRTEEVILDGQGRVAAVVVGVGGFLGIGEKAVAIPFDQIAWNTGEGAGPRSSTTPGQAPSAAAAASAGPDTMPGAKVSDNVFNVIEERRSGTVTEETGSVAAPSQPRGTATVPAGGTSATPVRAEIRFTRAALEAAPAFRYQRD
ncbi:PRC-barrel domain-containing protein [Methylobacterium iners]|uniref:PRC-barrel domain-containing protein n=1 Tax=Methylobacterium iners TaxID=418707 RepID=A0ABQ4RQR2_9HYPH|nr:PRC-barrel domain-containing protein [Methylobacterium iners]GJD93113.1 hypothetical protein OCOJLMKI_0302 [Methylobacterium iners]